MLDYDFGFSKGCVRACICTCASLHVRMQGEQVLTNAVGPLQKTIYLTKQLMVLILFPLNKII